MEAAVSSLWFMVICPNTAQVWGSAAILSSVSSLFSQGHPNQHKHSVSSRPRCTSRRYLEGGKQTGGRGGKRGWRQRGKEVAGWETGKLKQVKTKLLLIVFSITDWQQSAKIRCACPLHDVPVYSNWWYCHVWHPLDDTRKSNVFDQITITIHLCGMKIF